MTAVSLSFFTKSNPKSNQVRMGKPPDLMLKCLNHKYLSGWKIRLVSAWRCLIYKKWVLVAWSECEDGELDFHVTHKGIPVHEAIHRLKVDAYEILQNVEDQNCALDEVHKLIK